jgi:hypothetical protein
MQGGGEGGVTHSGQRLGRLGSSHFAEDVAGDDAQSLGLDDLAERRVLTSIVLVGRQGRSLP